ncbi:MAG TPA: SDR family oxidoreductase [Dehalococcoidia bacterium]|jgi:2-deoxy-D-gluconate 3-dehydrogenase|nr:SDR family oxidoreductase [Dehalococcoidia bacterium]HIA16141.1 SDR family oxidoreductase [Dehalococcoidia bacterium]HIM91520.1 SDR family oxidoreductase [Dehalococcoidia bacterium]HIN71284.1 SDR family oxidoreductase [Dehalococcoidia bacterium]HIO62738.1 SDR family oxidoreductase [Dehalococcoidia bacterium]|tara:strand:- start:4382 stop:5233 length:852 start_codon:yes stop_codon:yes gene_type:complete
MAASIRNLQKILGGPMLEEKLSLEGKTIVITGGGTGLGREMTLAMASAGADLVIASRRIGPIDEVAQAARDMGRRAITVSTDVTDTSQVAALMERALDEYGKVDVLLNNAGIVRGKGAEAIWDISDEDWRIGIDTNMSSAFFCSRAIAKHMVERGQGKIINVSSGFGYRGGRDNYMYAVGKGGIVQLTRTLATSLSRHGITSTCIVPGFLPTTGTDESNITLPRGDFIPIGRVGRPSELGAVAVFLASPGSDYMNGEAFAIDGGGLAGGVAPTGYAPEIPLEI